MSQHSNTNTIVIVGAGQAGGQAARQLLAEGYAGRIVLAGAESYPPYERPPLSKAVLKDTTAESTLPILSADELADPRIEFCPATSVTEVDPRGAIARLSSGESIRFDACLIATGGNARALSIPGAELCCNLRTLDDSRELRARLTPGKRLVIIGGGVIGCEVAATAISLGCETTILEAGTRLMARILPPAGSDWLASRQIEVGVRIATGARVEKIQRQGDALRVEGVDDRGAPLKIEADIVLSSVGMVPNAGLVPASAQGTSGGILTDACGRVAELPGIFALGDVAESWNAIYGRTLRLETWRNADKQARAIARTICGNETPHVEIPWMWTDQLGHNIQVVGLWTEGAKVVCRGNMGEPGSAMFWIEDGVLRGGVLIDAGRERRFLEKLVETGARPSPEALADPSRPLKSLLA